MGWRDDGLGRRLRARRTATDVRALEDDAGSRVGEACDCASASMRVGEAQHHDRELGGMVTWMMG